MDRGEVGCPEAASHLVGYQLGTIADEERELVERHLLACSACLRTYLALKRGADRAGSDRPRPEVKARLRAEVARTFPGARRSAAPVRALLARRIPLYQGVALAAIAAAVAVTAPALRSRVARGDAQGEPSIDTSRTGPASLHIY